MPALHVSTFLLMGTSSEGGAGGGQFGFLFFILLFFVIIYFFMIRPQQKKAKEQRGFLANLKKGDRVVTIGGIHGKIVSEADDHFMLEVDTNTKIKIERNVISLDFTKNLHAKIQGGEKAKS